MSRDTKAAVNGPATAVSTTGTARVKAENTGAVTSQVDSQFVGVASNSVTKDDAIASIGAGTFGSTGLAVSARTATDYAAIAKDVTNSVTGDTKALVGANTITAGTAGVTVEARDDSTLTATATQQTQVPDSPFVTITDARARNDVVRNVEASITSATVADTGDLAVLATSNPTIHATMASVSVRTKSEEFGNNYNPNKSAKALAATLAVNVIRGGVDAHVSGGTVNANNITIQARTDQALIDATAQVAAIAKTDEDAVSFPTLTGNNALSIGASLALNFIGWNLGTGVAQTALAGVDALLGTEFGATESPWVVQAYGRNAALHATGGLTVSADSAPLINSTVDNTAKSNNVGIFGVKSSAAGFILATNKLSGGSKAFVEYTGATPGTVGATGDLTVEATDDAGVYSNAKIVASSITTNDGGVRFFNQYENDGIDVQHHTDDANATSAAVAFGDKVRIARGFGDSGLHGRGLRVAARRRESGRRRAARRPLRRLPSQHRVGDQAPGARRPRPRRGRLRERRLHGRRLPLPRAEGPRRPRQPGLLGREPVGAASAVRPAASTSSRERRRRALDLNSQDYYNTDLWSQTGGHVGSVYEYMGPRRGVARPDLAGLHRSRLLEARHRDRAPAERVQPHAVAVGRDRRHRRPERRPRPDPRVHQECERHGGERVRRPRTSRR